MAAFKYTALDGAGKEHGGLLEADSARAARAQLRERGYEPIPVPTTELLKGGGGAKCCTLEIRIAPPA